MPPLDRTPVVSHQMHLMTFGHGRVEHSQHVDGEPVQPVVSGPGRNSRDPGAAHVVGDHVEVPRQEVRNRIPDGVVVGVAVDQQDRPVLLVSDVGPVALVDRQWETAGAGHYPPVDPTPCGADG